MECFMSRKQWSEIVRAAAISENLLERTRERTPYKDFRVIEFVEHTKIVTSEERLKRKVIYHEGCQSSFANIANLNRAKKRFSRSIDTGKCSMVKRKQGRTPKAANSDTTQTLTEKLAMQYQYDNYNKSACGICQEGENELMKVEFKATGRNIFAVAEKLSDKSFLFS